MDEKINSIKHGDCIKAMNSLPAGSVHLVFADPPFNIGYDYDVYQDKVGYQQYLDWSAQWISAVWRVLRPDGTFWLAIGDEYAAELKLESQKIGFCCRSWVVWYYTFGVNCKHKFTRSHAHLFHFVKDPDKFTFRDDDLDNRVPSARELVYNDRRANSVGRLPDDTWMIRPVEAIGELTGDEDATGLFPSSGEDTDRTFALRPQDLEQSFTPSENTWYFPRVAGTFKERAGFHGCQMPEQLLGRIVRTCSNSGDVVLDPFSGSATTLTVAKKLGRRYLGFDISKGYVRYGRERLKTVRVGDRLDGSPEPMKSAPRTNGRQPSGSRQKRRRSPGALRTDPIEREAQYDRIQVEMTLEGIAEAFRKAHDGFSADRVVADPNLNEAFAACCTKLGLAGEARTWNMLLFRLRKRGKLSHIETVHRTSISWEDCDKYMFASEIAWRIMIDKGLAKSLDEMLCDPVLAALFDATAARFSPGYDSFHYRWAALKIRKEAKYARSRATVLTPPSRLGERVSIEALDTKKLRRKSGLYVLSEPKRNRKLYVGETLDLSGRFTRKCLRGWSTIADSIQVQTLSLDPSAAGRLVWQSCLVKKLKPRLNCIELSRPAS